MIFGLARTKQKCILWKFSFVTSHLAIPQQKVSVSQYYGVLELLYSTLLYSPRPSLYRVYRQSWLIGSNSPPPAKSYSKQGYCSRSTLNGCPCYCSEVKAPATGRAIAGRVVMKLLLPRVCSERIDVWGRGGWGGPSWESPQLGKRWTGSVSYSVRILKQELSSKVVSLSVISGGTFGSTQINERGKLDTLRKRIRAMYNKWYNTYTI